MNFRKTAFCVLLLASAGTAAASASNYRLADTVRAMEARYPGTVEMIELDDAGDRPAHYHVDMRFPQSGIARLDVDAATLAVASRDPMPRTPPGVPLLHVVAVVTTAIEDGRVVATRLDFGNGAPAHYDVDVALPSGALARLKFDAATGAIAWRAPAVVME
jgi:uncharacterized membrane protein YkoI